MTLLFFILFAVVIFGVMIILSILRGVSSVLFGKQQTSYSSGNYSSTSDNQSYQETNKPHKKVFAKDEGEYVSYEEVD
ncbi:MAG: DUF4834 family protein [Prevotella sp.]|jgi:hypothetical protein|nr:DUF4834 family protein [Prevotella sp.]